MMDNNALIDIIGWIGAVAVLVAYGLVSTKKLESNSTAYHLLNLAGGIFLITNTIYYRAYPSTMVNLVWAGIAVYGIVKYSKAAEKRHE
jgi:hypothetical protein